MGLRGELFTSKVAVSNRSYFFNVKENRLGDLFMTLVESKPNEGEGFERHQVVVFADDVQGFLKGFEESLRFMEHEAGKRKRDARARDDSRRDQRPSDAERGAPRPAKAVRDGDAGLPFAPRKEGARQAYRKKTSPSGTDRAADRRPERATERRYPGKSAPRPQEGGYRPRAAAPKWGAGQDKSGTRKPFKGARKEGPKPGPKGSPKSASKPPFKKKARITTFKREAG
jgi:hypothetical protein